MIKILLVDDDSLVRQGLRMRFALEKDMLVIGEAEDGQQAVELVKTLKPDVVVMDVAMPNLDGVAATETIHQLAPQTIVVILSLHGDNATRVRASAAGATAFLTKGENEKELLPIIRAAIAKIEQPDETK